MTLDETHDPKRRVMDRQRQRSGVRFPIQNPAVRRVPPRGDEPRGGVAIGDHILDVSRVCARREPRRASPRVACAQPTLNALMGLAAGAVVGACGGGCRASAPRRAPARQDRTAPGADDGCGTLPAGARRRLHRLLRRRSTTRRTSGACSGPTIRCCRTTSGCRSAITAARRRSCVSGTPVRRPRGQIEGRRRRTPAVRSDAAARLRARARALHRRGGNALGEPVPIDATRRRTLRRCACSTTGRRATSRRGSTSRSVRSSPKNFATTISPVDRDAGGAGAVPLPRPPSRPEGDPGAAALSRPTGRPHEGGARHRRSRSGCSTSADARAGCRRSD